MTEPSGLPPELEDRLIAAGQLIGRTGATSLETGYLEDDVPVELARWWAKATYRGAVITVDEQPDPVTALETLAMRLIAGGRCAWCGGMVVLDDVPRDAFAVVGTGARLKLCKWERTGQRWDRTCGATERILDAGRDDVVRIADQWASDSAGATITKPNRAARRRQARADRRNR